MLGLRSIFRFLILTVVALLSACSSMRREKPAEVADLGDHTFQITTEVGEAQTSFDRGLALAYAFSHAAAEREFRRAAELDPNAAMPWWGVALVNGPHINFPLVPEKNAAIAWDALKRAQERKHDATALEKQLIEALATRYVEKQGNDRSKLDLDYSKAMKTVWEQNKDNADVGALYAESLMDLHPWDLWTIKGEPKEWTPEIVQVLEDTIALNDKHPLALHLYIHTIEASNTPEKAVPAADILRDLVPGAGHLVHMPGHIYVRVGRWEDAALANEKAIVADAEFHKNNPYPGFYATYMLHNRHFLTFVRMMQGQNENALRTAREMIAAVPPQYKKEYGAIADGFMAIAIEVLVRFGKWQEILSEPEPEASFPLARALWRFSRATAYNALKRPQEALKERRAFIAAIQKVPPDATFGNNKAHTLLQIAMHVLDGEAAAIANNFGPALASLKKAVKIEDTLLYDEPPDWILPVRHALGLTLLRARQPAEAEKVYREDLKKFPKNGWSLFGLARAVQAQGRSREAREILHEFDKEWAQADIKIEGSCFCQSGK